MLIFNEDYYLQSKLAQLAASNVTDAYGNAFTESSLRQAIAAAGYTIEQHFQLFHTEEGTSPNPYFNTTEYLEAKLAQLQSFDANWTMSALRQSLAQAGLTAAQHYEQFGCRETDAQGRLINPSNAFDANAYVAAKLAQLRTAEPDAWVGKTAMDVLQAISAAGMNLVQHYMQFGATEAADSDIAMVQTVPVAERVANDPFREYAQRNVPSNYNKQTDAPESVGVDTASAVPKPCDMGGLKALAAGKLELIATPLEPVATPYDDEYVEIPGGGITDTNEHPVVLVKAAVTDSEGNMLAGVARYGVAEYASDGSVYVLPVDGDGNVQYDATPLQTQSNGTTSTLLETSSGETIVMHESNGQTSYTDTDGNPVTLPEVAPEPDPTPQPEPTPTPTPGGGGGGGTSFSVGSTSVQVYEAGLSDGTKSNQSSAPISVSGSLSITGNPETIAVNEQEVYANGTFTATTIQTDSGKLQLTSFSGSRLQFTYAISSALSHTQDVNGKGIALTDSISVTAALADNTTASGTITATIQDDCPQYSGTAPTKYFVGATTGFVMGSLHFGADEERQMSTDLRDLNGDYGTLDIAQSPFSVAEDGTLRFDAAAHAQIAQENPALLSNSTFYYRVCAQDNDNSVTYVYFSLSPQSMFTLDATTGLLAVKSAYADLVEDAAVEAAFTSSGGCTVTLPELDDSGEATGYLTYKEAFSGVNSLEVPMEKGRVAGDRTDRVTAVLNDGDATFSFTPSAASAALSIGLDVYEGKLGAVSSGTTTYDVGSLAVFTGLVVGDNIEVGAVDFTAPTSASVSASVSVQDAASIMTTSTGVGISFISGTYSPGVNEMFTATPYGGGGDTDYDFLLQWDTGSDVYSLILDYDSKSNIGRVTGDADGVLFFG